MQLTQKIARRIKGLCFFKQQDMGDIVPVFIVSTGRTGTKFFSVFFNYFNNILALHEPYPDFRKLSVNYARGKVSFNAAAKQIEKNRRLINYELKKKKINIYIESNNRFFSLLKPLRAVFPGAKIIYIVRDGRDYVRSGMSRNWYTASDKNTRLRADMFPGDPYYEKWNKMNRFEKIAWRWQKKDGIIHDDIKTLDNTIKVTFEDIFLHPDNIGIYDITRFMGIDDAVVAERLEKTKNQKINTNPKHAIPAWKSWDEEMKKAFDEIAASHMKVHYDYKGMSGKSS